MSSTTAPEAPAVPGRWARGRSWRPVRPLLVVAFWVAVWQGVAVAVDQEILVAAPAQVLARAADLGVTADFWATVWHTSARIGVGFVAAAVVGVLTATLASTVRAVDALLSPLITAIRSTPVVSFIILVLLWADSRRLAVVISFLMVMPIIHTTVLVGIAGRDRAMLEVATVFRVPWQRRVAAIDVPAVLPFFLAGCRVGVGLAWKSGIAAEVIGLPRGSIGERLYDAKLLLSTPDVFVWTGVVVGLAYGFERLIDALLRRVERAPGRVGTT